jgi:hypothetical protein
MAAEPRLAILQQLIVGRPASAAFPRLYQFGMRAGMRVWATGQAWWQGDEGPYWGHNAIIRIAPFRAHARLEALPDGSPILSHDQVEAARLHAAGWKVAMLPIEAGSLTATPPALPEFIAREARWGAGSMQYFRLFRLPGLTWMGRWQFAQAIMLFAVAPLWALVLVFALANAAGGGEADPSLLALAMLVLGGAAVLDQVGDRADLQAVGGSELHQIGQAGHRAVVLQDLAEPPGHRRLAHSRHSEHSHVPAAGSHWTDSDLDVGSGDNPGQRQRLQAVVGDDEGIIERDGGADSVR